MLDNNNRESYVDVVFYLICDLAKIDFQKPEDIFIREIIANFLLQNKDIEEARELALKIREIYRSHQVYFFKDEGEEI